MTSYLAVTSSGVGGERESIKLMSFVFLVEIQVHDAIAAPQLYRGIVTSKDQFFGTVVPLPSTAG